LNGYKIIYWRFTVLDDSDELQAAFSKAGAVVSTSIIMDKMTGRSRGFGFVEMGSDDDAQKAIEMWNGQDFDGRKLTVNEANL